MPASRRGDESKIVRALWSAEIPHPKAYRLDLGRTCRSTSIDAPRGRPAEPPAHGPHSCERESAQDAHGPRDAARSVHVKAREKEPATRTTAVDASDRVTPQRGSSPDGPRKLALARTPALSRIRDVTLALPSQPSWLQCSQSLTSGSHRAPECLAPRAMPRGVPRRLGVSHVLPGISSRPHA
ncbi:hypothetical protein L226DRAFT_530658 [Lentinus tigrinus ALCF2SS1-7]|uniref:uncharacterized protein n=1 Tax=Lentinus tigrinus ALCF2SS1-7 TaxID=1328758 RepID=UPI001165F03C|nr:hypothetical protein L226DRAFT_530658 [Lentinus tigrinus ALCF2SS1-7]